MNALFPLALTLALAAPPLPPVLTGHEYVPPAARRSAAERHALVAVAADADEDPVMRARALTLLIDEPEAAPEALRLTRGFLTQTAEPFLARKGVVALARLQGPAAGPELVARYRAAAADVRLREACARALRSLGEPFAAERRRLAETEPDTVVRAWLTAPRAPVPATTPTPAPGLPGWKGRHP
jgi:hypothetical protein